MCKSGRCFKFQSLAFLPRDSRYFLDSVDTKLYRVSNKRRTHLIGCGVYSRASFNQVNTVYGGFYKCKDMPQPVDTVENKT